MAAVLRLVVILLCVALPTTALAVPLVSVDTDPGAGATQAATDVALGASFDVDILIEDVADLNGFQFTLAYDPSVLMAVDVMDGGFLTQPVIVFDQTLGSLSVSFSEISQLGATSSGAGVLARLSFEALALGTSSLDLIVSGDATQTLILSGAFGVPICGDPGGTACLVADGSIRVLATEPGPAPIPEPHAALLFATGAALVALQLRRDSARA